MGVAASVRTGDGLVLDDAVMRYFLLRLTPHAALAC